jgi:hypothetical protein
MKKEHENVIPTPAELRVRHELAYRTSLIEVRVADLKGRFVQQKDGGRYAHPLRKGLEREAKERREERRRELEMKISEDFHSARNAIFDESKKLLTRPKKKWYPMENKWR